jgi:L-fucose isomerase-like protein
MATGSPQTFALYFGNRGFFPESLISQARGEMAARLSALGHGVLMMDADATPHGAVEGTAEGRVYARFLAENRGKYDGVILCLPNFGDETGAIAALQDAGVPILVHAYPDELDKMGFASRRDAFCGKFSVMDVFCQYGVPFTALPPHVVAPSSEVFARQIGTFAAICRVVGGMSRMTVGAIGARTTAFKTVRFDELTLQKYGITTEVLDLSEIMLRVRDVGTRNAAYVDSAERLRACTSWEGVPEEAFESLVKLSVVLDQVRDEYAMDALSLRCWIELEKTLGVSPCVLLGDLNDRGVPAACELDVCNAIAMRALSLAAEQPATCLDWNNNFGDSRDKCILFHCGPVPPSLMQGKGRIVDHPMFAKAIGAGCGWGCNVGRIKPSPMTFSSAKTEDGRLVFYLGEGRFTDDTVPEEFFGCAGVGEIEGLQDVLRFVGYEGFRHHVSVAPGHVAQPVLEAFDRYLGYDVTCFGTPAGQGA